MKKFLPHIISVAIILLVNIFFFFPQFQGKVIRSGDIVAYQGASKEAVDFRKETGEETLWTNSMFGGMPTYMISAKSPYNVMQYVEKGLSAFIPRPAGYFILGMISFYIAMLLFGANPWVSLAASLMFAYSTINLVLFEAGHMTKIRAIMLSAPIVAGVIMTMKGKHWWGGIVFTLFLALNVRANHPQMTYYLGLALGIYMLTELVFAIKNGTIASYGKGVAVLIVGSLLALSVSAGHLLSANEYAKSTMRGKPVLEQAAGDNASADGLEWDYAMSWSAGSLDLLSLFIDRAAGGATVEELPKDSQFAKVTGQRRGAQGYLYFGSLPSTAGPYYFGAITFFLFILGLVLVKDRFKWALLAGFLLTLFIALGKNFEVFNHLLFDYFPLFSKFRTPNSILSISGVLMLVLAGLALKRLSELEDKTAALKPTMIATGVVGGFALLFGLLGPSFIDFTGAYDDRIAQGQQRIIDALIEDRTSLMRSSALKAAGLIFLSGGLLYMYLKEKLSFKIALIVIAFLNFADISFVAKRYLSNDDFISERKYDGEFKLRAVDQQILQDPAIHYRVQDFTVDTYNSAATSYHHKTVGGYHPAKLQRIQDIIERHLSQRSQQNPLGNEEVYNMLNTKYFIFPGQNNQPQVQMNQGAMGNGWFVGNIQMVESANEEIDALGGGFSAATTAVVHNEFADYVSGINATAEGSVKLTSYAPNEMVYQVQTQGEQLAVFSEVWYQPGWNAYIDGESVEHIRANYLLRALRVPAGTHEVVFKFEPTTFARGNMLSLLASLLIVGGLGFVGYREWKG